MTFQNARSLHALAPQLRLDRLMLETDAPYLAPHPHRGQRNEPAYIPLMAADAGAAFWDDGRCDSGRDDGNCPPVFCEDRTECGAIDVDRLAGAIAPLPFTDYTYGNT